MQYMSEKDK